MIQMEMSFWVKPTNIMNILRWKEGMTYYS